MPSDTMHVNVNFSDWVSLSEEQKSLINFFMKDAVIRFYGTYDNVSGSFQNLYGNIQTSYRLLAMPYNDIGEGGTSYAHIYFLDLPLNTSITFPATPIAYNLPPATCTLTSTNGVFRMCECVSSESYDYELEEDVTITTCTSLANITSNGCSLSFLRGGTANVDPTFRPSEITANSPLYEVGMALEPGQDLRYNFHLRTEEFRIKTTANTTLDCYYKIGVFPFGQTSVQTITSYLTSSDRKFCYGKEYVYDSGDVCFYISDENANEPDRLTQEKVFNSGEFRNIMHKIIMPLRNPFGKSDDAFYGLLYAELYSSSTNEPVQTTTTGLVSNVIAKEDGEWPSPPYEDMVELSMTLL